MTRCNVFAAVTLAGAIGWMAGTRAEDAPPINAPRPEGELVRQRLELARRGFKLAHEYWLSNVTKMSEAGVAVWSRRIAEAELVADDKKTKLEIVAAHRDRMRELAERTKAAHDNGLMRLLDVTEAEYQLLEAESWLLTVWIGEEKK